MISERKKNIKAQFQIQNGICREEARRQTDESGPAGMNSFNESG